MLRLDHTGAFLRRLHMLPLSWLGLSQGKRLLIVLLTFGLGVVGLWVFFPLVHNGSSMFLPIVSACWLFRYRGLLFSLILNGIAFQLAYVFLLRGLLPDQAFVEGGILGFGTSLGLGLIICWLRTTIDLMQKARQTALEAEQARLLALQREVQVKSAYEQQRHVNELKDQFLLHISHELRTPLSVLGSSLELLKEYFELLAPQEREKIFTKALANYEELVNLVNRVLDTTVIMNDLPKAQLGAVSPRRIVLEALNHLDPRDVEAYTIRVLVPEQIIVWADAQFLHQVLQNLLSNIFKYVPKKTEIRIEATQATPSSTVCLSVQDAGPGIPREEHVRLFEKFTRLKRDLTGATRGTGLGLYICKGLVEAMGGHIWVESSGREGEGCRFCITLPPFSPTLQSLSAGKPQA